MISWQIHTPLQGAGGPMSLNTDIQLETGQLIGLYGPSGAGKTTLLRTLAGLFRPTKGKIQFNGATWLHTETGVFISPRKRRVGFVFQDYALFPNMTVIGNLQYARNRKQAGDVVEDLLNIMELKSLARRYPHQLSRGQQQRVALARALVPQPQLLLLDEPFSALDTELRQKLGIYLKNVHQKYALTTILVSHDLDHLQRLSDCLLYIEKGKIESQVHTSTYPTITGEILAMRVEGNWTWVTVGNATDTYRLPIAKADAQELHVGEQVELGIYAAKK